MAVHHRAVAVELVHEPGRVREPHGGRQAGEAGRVGRQPVGLLVAHLLQPVLDPAQEHVGRVQLGLDRGGDAAGRDQGGEHLADGASLKLGGDAAADQLEHLAEELDLPDPARAELDVLLQPLAGDLLGDHLLHRPQRLERAEIEVAPIDERVQAPEEVVARRPVARDGPRLDPGVALPVPALLLVVLLHGVEAQDHGAVVAERPQAQVDAEDLPLRVRPAEDLDEPAAEAREELLVRQLPPAPGRLAGGRVGEDQVDVRGKVEFARAELPERQHHEPHGGAVGVQRGAEVGALPPVKERERLVHAGLGQIREVARGLGQVGPPGQVAPGDAHHLAPPESSQPKGELLRVRCPLQQRLEPSGELSRSGGPIYEAAGSQAEQQGGVADQAFGREVAEGQHLPQLVLEVPPGRQLQPGLTECLAQARVFVVGVCAEDCGHRGGRHGRPPRPRARPARGRRSIAHYPIPAAAWRHAGRTCPGSPAADSGDTPARPPAGGSCPRWHTR